MVDTQLRVYNHPGRSIMARARRTYTPEFKAEAVRLVTEQGYSVAEAARSLGLGDNLLRSWKQALEAKGEQAYEEEVIEEKWVLPESQWNGRNCKKLFGGNGERCSLSQG